MSQSPLARTTRRNLPAFSHTPSRLSHSTSRGDLRLPSTSPEKEKAGPSNSFSSSSPSPSPVFSSQITPQRTETRYRNAGTSTTPHTPKIHYSPYATSTPPSGISKSTSIPFDMAASLKAGRLAEEESRRRSSTPLEPIKTKRFVRKKNLIQRLISSPEQVWEKIALWYPLTIEDMFPDKRFANPISLFLHTIQWVLVAPLWKSREEPSSVLRSTPLRGVSDRWGRFEEDDRSLTSSLGGRWAILIFTILLLLLACANSIYLFTKFRTYDMQLRSANDPVKSPHASPIAAPRPQTSDDVFGVPVQSDSHDTRERKVVKWAAKAVLAFTKWSFWAVLSIFGHQSNSTTTFGGSEEKIQSLRVWEPSDFCLAFFCAYPPSAPLLSYLLTPLHPFLTPFLHLVTSFLLSHLALSYNQLVKDRMVLSAEVMREYDRRFVYKKVFGGKVDRAVQTEQAESVW